MPRIRAIDAARGAALLAMAIYHLAWDLEFFGYAEPGMTAVGGWRLFARTIASSFLFLVGFSLFLAHGKGIRWRPFWRRFAMVAGAAALITAATRAATPDAFIFFGILHQIALGSLLGLAFLRVPTVLLAVLAAVVVAAPHVLRTHLLDQPPWWWTGLSAAPINSNDYVPLFPWFGAILAGIAAARLARAQGWLDGLAGLRLPAMSRWLELAGRHSLAVYLLHQPVLIACVWTAAQLFPPSAAPPQRLLERACRQECASQMSEAFCVSYCACVLEEVERAGLLDAVAQGPQNVDVERRLGRLAGTCSARVLQGESEGGEP